MFFLRPFGAFLALCVCSTALANSDGPIRTISNESSLFDHLHEMFLEGETPNLDELRGWHSGRCYQYDAKDTAQNSLLTGVMKLQETDDGPLNPPRYAFKLIPIVNRSDKADYYDELHEGQINNIQQTIDANFDSFTEVGVFDESLTSKYTAGHLKLYVRRYEDYYISMQTYDHEEGDVRSVEDLDVRGMCYYFRKVYE